MGTFGPRSSGWETLVHMIANLAEKKKQSTKNSSFPIVNVKFNQGNNLVIDKIWLNTGNFEFLWFKLVLIFTGSFTKNDSKMVKKKYENKKLSILFCEN